MNDIKEKLLDAVPPLSAPPDRLAAIRGRARFRRRVHVAGTALAALASVAALGTTMAVLTPAGVPDRVGDPRPTAISSPPFSPPFSPPLSPPGGRESEPPKDFPMPAPGVCPPTVKFRHMPEIEPYPGGTLPQISGVTLCRYSQGTYQLDETENSLTSGPEPGNVPAFRNALLIATQPYPGMSSGGPAWASGSAPAWASPSASGSCSPGPVAPPPWTVDVLFVHSPDGTTRAVILQRYKCHPPTHTDPLVAVWTAIDAVLGRPYA